MRTVSRMQVDLRLALTLPGEANIEVLLASTEVLIEQVVIIGYNGPTIDGGGHEFLVRTGSGEIISRSAVDLGLMDGADRIAFFATNTPIAAISVA